MTSSSLYPSNVAATLTHHREIVSVRAFDGGGRAHRYLIGFYRPNALNLVRIQSTSVSTPLGRVVAAVSSLGSEATARILERGGPVGARILAGLLQGYAGTSVLGSAICNRLPVKATAGKCFSFLFPFVHCSPKPTNGIAYTLFFAPVLSFVPIHHAAEKSMEKALCRPEKIRISSRKIK